MDIFNAIWCAIIKVFNLIVEHLLQTIIEAIAWVIDLLPSSPLPDTIIVWGEFGRSIGYFLPVGTFIQHFIIMLALVLVWYAYEYILRLIKMIK